MLVIGCGVVGLTTGIRLLEAGHGVTIVAEQLPPHTTSNVAGAIWYPYRVYPVERVVDWARSTLNIYREELYPDAAAGVVEMSFTEFLEEKIDVPWWHEAIDHYERVPADEIPASYVDGFRLRVPRIDVPVHMDYLVQRFRSLGGTIEQLDTAQTDMSALAQRSKRIVNCTGLGARTLCDDDDTRPIRGQIVRIENPGLREALTDQGETPTYIIPRVRDCILGGTADHDAWDLSPDPQVARQIVERCARLEPRVRNARILEHRVGLRPGRGAVRLEVETLPGGVHVVHNYGHGGAGFTLNWGCAEEVVERIAGLDA